MRFMSWNVDGIRSCIRKGFFDIVYDLDVDICCLQEVKATGTQIPWYLPEYHVFLNPSTQRGQSGVMIASRFIPDQVVHDFCWGVYGHDGRVLTADFISFYLVCCYSPNSQIGLKRLDYRLQWDADLRTYLCRLKMKKPVIICGDLNVANNRYYRGGEPVSQWSPGFTDEEYNSLYELKQCGFYDVLEVMPAPTISSWRLDYIMVTSTLVQRIADTAIMNASGISDHDILLLDLNLD